MMGGMFAGTDECDGDIIKKHIKTDEMLWHDGAYRPKVDVKQFQVFYGMSSELAQVKHFGGKKDYRASEGTVTEVEYKGSVGTVIKDLLGGIRSTGTYIGAKDIKNYGKCATFIRVNRVHDKNL